MISVCIAIHNGAKYIEEQLASILKQLGPRDEVIISDDGSTDDTIEKIHIFKDPRISIIYLTKDQTNNDPHSCVTKNFENALIHSKGDYIFLSDQDDIWFDDKVEKCMSNLKKNLLVVHNMQRISETGEIIGLGYKKFRFSNFFQISPTYYGCVMAFRRELLDVALPFPTKLLVHDFWLGILAEQIGKVGFINQELIKYRVHNKNTSTNKITSFIYKIKYRLYTLAMLVKRLNSGNKISYLL